MPWGHRCRVGFAAIRPSGWPMQVTGPGRGRDTVPGWQDCAQILCSRWHGPHRTVPWRVVQGAGFLGAQGLQWLAIIGRALVNTRQSARLAFPRVRRKLAPPPQGERHAPLARLDCYPPDCACRRRRRARRRLFRRRERADQAQDGAQLEVPGPAGLVLRRRRTRATSRPRASTSRSTRATARRRRSPRWRAAPTTPASATSMR